MKRIFIDAKDKKRRFFANRARQGSNLKEGVVGEVSEKIYLMNTEDKDKLSQRSYKRDELPREEETDYETLLDERKSRQLKENVTERRVTRDSQIYISDEGGESLNERKEAFLTEEIESEKKVDTKAYYEKLKEKAPKVKRRFFSRKSDASLPEREVIDKDGTVIVSPTNSTRKKLNVFDKFFIALWSYICMVITKIAEAINILIIFIFKKGAQIRYLKAFVSIALIICFFLVIILPSTAGKIKIDDSDVFSDGLLAVKQREGTADDGQPIYKWGYINRSGKMKIAAAYDEARPFRYGSAFIRSKDYWQLIGTNGKLKIETKYYVTDKNPEPVGQFSVEVKLAKVCLNGKYGYITPSGKMKIAPQYDDANDFKEEIARVKLGNREFFISGKGKAVGSYYEEVRQMNNGLAAVKNSGVWGFVNKKGKMVINATYNEVTDFQGRFAAVRNGDGVGIIDNSGKIVVSSEFNDIYPDMSLKDYLEMWQSSSN